MSKLLTRSIIITLLVLLSLSIASHAFALQLEYPSWFPIKDDMELSQLVLALFNAFLMVAGVAAFVILVVAGIRYLRSIGNPSILADARNQAISAILGLALLLCSYLILTTINPQLVELKEPGLKPIEPVAYAPPGEIVVEVKKPTIDPPKRSFTLTSGQKPIDLISDPPFQLIIDTDGLKARLQAPKVDPNDPSKILPNEFWKPWEENLKADDTVKVDKTFKVEKEVYKLTEGQEIPVKFQITTGNLTAQPTEIFVSLTISQPEVPLLIPRTDTAKWPINLTGVEKKELVGLTGIAKIIASIDPGLQTLTLYFEVSGQKIGDDITKVSYKGKDSISKDIRGIIHSSIPKIGHKTLVARLSVGVGTLPGNCQGTGFAVKLYKKRDQQGEPERCYKVGEVWPAPPDGEDFLSFFLDPAAGVALQVFHEENYQGDRICFKESYNNLEKCLRDPGISKHHWNDGLKSLKVIVPADCPGDKVRTTYDASGTAKTSQSDCPQL